MIPLAAGSMGGLWCLLKLVAGVGGAAALGLTGSCALGGGGSDGAERELAMVRAAHEESREAEATIRGALAASRAEAEVAIDGWADEADAHMAARAALAAAVERHKAALAGAADDPGACRPGCTMPDDLRSIVEDQP